MTTDTLVLGRGYLGKWFCDSIEPSKNKNALWTSRSNPSGILFNFDNVETWANLPEAKCSIWTFPVTDLSSLKEFLDQYGKRLGKLLIIGSTGQILVEDEGQVVNEKSPRDLSSPRARCENFLQERGAILVSSSGIYGPGRSPLDWIKKGYVGSSKKRLNAIHVKDLSQVVRQAAEFGVAGEHYIASDKSPQSWEDIIAYSRKNNWLSEVPTQKTSSKISKFVDSSWTLKTLKVDLKFPSVYKGLMNIEST